MVYLKGKVEHGDIFEQKDMATPRKRIFQSITAEDCGKPLSARKR